MNIPYSRCVQNGSWWLFSEIPGKGQHLESHYKAECPYPVPTIQLTSRLCWWTQGVLLSKLLQLSPLKQCVFIILSFRRSEVQCHLTELISRCHRSTFLSGGSRGKSFPLHFSTSRGYLHFLAPSSTSLSSVCKARNVTSLWSSSNGYFSLYDHSSERFSTVNEL